MVVNDNAGILDERGAFGFFASKLAPTRGTQRCINGRHKKSTPQGASFESGFSRSLSRLILRQDQLAFLIHRNLVAWITIHAHLTFLAIQRIPHVVTYNLVTDVVNRVTAGLGGGVGITLLHAFLHLVAGITTTDSARDRGDLLAGAATNLVTQQTTRQCTDHRTGDLMLIFHRRLPGDRYILAHFTWSLDLCLDRLNGEYLCVLWAAFNQAVGGHSTPGSYTDSTQYSTNQHRLVHMNLLDHHMPNVSALLPALEHKKRREFNSRLFCTTSLKDCSLKDGRRLPSRYWPEESDPRCSGSARSAPRSRCRSTSKYPPEHR